MKVVSGTQMRQLDARTIKEAGIPGEHLMRIAGALAAGGIMEYRSELLKCDVPCDNLIILAGHGNNAGDAFMVARMFANTECQVFLHCMSKEEELSPDAQKMFQELPDKIKGRIRYELNPNDLRIPGAIIIDGMLGTGCHGPLRSPCDAWCRMVNEAGLPVVSLDMPTGLDADSGCAAENTVKADLTLTMGYPKKGMFTQDGIRHCGRIRVLDIGIPESFIAEMENTSEAVTLADVKPFFGREEFDTYKNERGHLLVCGGSSDYSGAPLLASEAGLRAGAGLVTCVIPVSVIDQRACARSLILCRVPGNGSGTFNENSVAPLKRLMERADAVVLGPGMGTESPEVLSLFLASEKPLLLDADALNTLSMKPELLVQRKAPLVMTPHAGEMRRLCAAFQINENLTREEQALSLAERTRAVVVLKGPRSVIASPEGRLARNLSGCPALATAGSGDLLAGMIGAMLAKGCHSAFDCAASMVFLHGYAAELASPVGSRGWIADDFLFWISAAIRKVSVRA